MGEETVLTKATSKSDSLRTTVPMGIVKQFNMKEKDVLNWNIEVEGSKLVIVAKYSKQVRFEVPEKKTKEKKSKSGFEKL